MKKKCCLVLFVLLLIAPSFALNATVVSSAGWQNVNQTIVGITTGYTFDVPMHWRTHISVNRVFFAAHSEGLVEQLIFHYNSSSSSPSSAPLLELAIFRQESWNDNAGFILLTETNDHVYALRPATNNPYVFGTDRLMFSNFLREASNPTFMINYISVPVGSDTVVRNTVSVNGVRMNAPSYVNALRVVNVPLREVAEALGYTVGWDATTNRASISSETFHTTIGQHTATGHRHSITNLSGISYVSTMFLLQVMGCNVEIDEFGNVRITK